MAARAIALLVLFVAVGCGGDTATGPLRSYTLELRVDDSVDRYRYVADDAVDIRIGDEVTFELSNTGTLPHDLQVVDPAGATLGRSEAIAPGAVTSLTVRFDTVGFHRLNCLVGDHLTAHDMQTFVEVTDQQS